jgi:hypothetical protein
LTGGPAAVAQLRSKGTPLRSGHAPRPDPGGERQEFGALEPVSHLLGASEVKASSSASEGEDDPVLAIEAALLGAGILPRTLNCGPDRTHDEYQPEASPAA